MEQVALRQIWTWYLLTVCVIAASAGLWGSAVERMTWVYVAIHLVLLAALQVCRRWAGTAQRPCRIHATYSLLALPIVFMSIALILPSIHPEPWEWWWIEVDRAIFGVDPTVWLQGLHRPWITELLQLCYSVFYFVPIAAVLAAGRWSGRAAFDRSLRLVVFGFLLSYLGYLLWPTLPPYRFLEHGPLPEGLWLAGQLYQGLDAAELNRWNCFPSGHTMLSLLSLVLMWQYGRPAFWCFLPVVTLLVFSTMALRYHYAIDVIAGICGVPLAIWLGDRVPESKGDSIASPS